MIDPPFLRRLIISSALAPLSLPFSRFDTMVACSEVLIEERLCQIPQCLYLAAAEG